MTLEEIIEIAQNLDATTHQVGCMRPDSKASHYRHKFINSKETGSQLQEPTGTDSSHKDQVPMIRNKQSLEEKVVSAVGRNRHISKVSFPQRRQSASSVGRKGITVPCADQRVKMQVSMSYKSSLHQLPTAWTAY